MHGANNPTCAVSNDKITPDSRKKPIPGTPGEQLQTNPGKEQDE